MTKNSLLDRREAVKALLADRGELLAWLRQLRDPPQQTFVVHGEPDASDTLRADIQTLLGWRVRVPAYGEVVEL